jgi:ribonucleoside-diphosphate reductase alpha chain
MHRRLAKELYRIEHQKFKQPITEEEIYDALKGFKRIVPQGSILFGVGNEQYTSISNCFILPSPPDSYAGICYVDQCIVQVAKRRGGAGFDISTLRPNGAITRNSSRSSTGPVSFAQKYSDTIRRVGQAGRRGATILSMDIHHPDSIEFAQSKLEETDITGANISVRLSDEFLSAVERGDDYEKRWNIKSYGMVNATNDWNTIVNCAWKRAEPGLLFWDKILRSSLPQRYEKYGYGLVSTNPCNEISGYPFASCLLMTLNAYGYVRNKFQTNAYFDWQAFYNDAKLTQRLMDDLVDIELEKIDDIIRKIEDDPEEDKIKAIEIDIWRNVKERCKQTRRIGIGLTGLGDTLASLNYLYGSRHSIEFVDQLYFTLKFGVVQSSIELAKELGYFELFDWELEKDHPFWLRLKDEVLELDTDIVLDGHILYNDMAKYGRRNLDLLTSSPAGSISILTQTTSAIEPLMEIETIRRKKINANDKTTQVDFVNKMGEKFSEFIVLHRPFVHWMEATGKEDVEESPWHKALAYDIKPKDRLTLQATVQKHITMNISSTINLPAETTQEEIAQIYTEAWKNPHINSITVYRQGCRDDIISKKKRGIIRSNAPERPKQIRCDVHHTSVKGQRYFVLVGLYEDDPYEVFAGKNGFLPNKIKNGTIIRKRKGYYIAQFDNSDIELSPITAACDENEEAITRLVSTALRHGTDIKFLVKQLERVGQRGSLHNFAIGVARILKRYIPDGTKEDGEVCPQCGGTNIVRQGGCPSCTCGWSKCV